MRFLASVWSIWRRAMLVLAMPALLLVAALAVWAAVERVASFLLAPSTYGASHLGALVLSATPTPLGETAWAGFAKPVLEADVDVVVVIGERERRSRQPEQ